jgi:thiamine kinase-like enzyme
MKTTPTSSLYEIAEGVCIVSARPELSSLFLSNKELEDLQNTIVLSHNDLELRNILVRNNSKSEKTTSTSYELAAITDWEFAGFFPRAFETAVEDSELGIGNLYYDWYKMVRTATASVDNASQKLSDAVQIIVDSRRLKWKRNVVTEVRKRWLLREGLEMRTEFGWVRKEGVEERDFSKKENEELEMDVLRDWGMI